MSFYFRESVIDHGTLVIRHTLSRGGGGTNVPVDECPMSGTTVTIGNKLVMKDGNLMV